MTHLCARTLNQSKSQLYGYEKGEYNGACWKYDTTAEVQEGK